MAKVAIIESKMSRTNWADRFDNAFEYDRYALCSDSTKKKVLKKPIFASPKKESSTNSKVSTQDSKRQIIPLTEKGCKNLTSANGISTTTAEYVAKQAGVSPRSVSLWKARYSSKIGCYFTFDTPKGPKTCWSSTAKSENEKVTYFMGVPMKPVLVQDPGKTPFLVMGACLDFRPKTKN